MAEAINVAVSGAAGRMGQAVCDAVEGTDDLALVGRADPQLDLALQDVLGDADVVVDFTTPDVALENARMCLEAGVHFVVGTSGVDFSQLDGAGSANLFFGPNFAIGAVLMIQAAKMVAPHMPECEIVELHHDKKVDAPSFDTTMPIVSAGRPKMCAPSDGAPTQLQCSSGRMARASTR